MPPQGSASPISSPYGAYLAGLVAQSDGDLEAAADYMLQALPYDPDNPDLLYASLQLAAATGRPAEAVQVAGRVLTLNTKQRLGLVVMAVGAARTGSPTAKQKRKA